MGFSRLYLSVGAFVLSTGAWKLDTDSCGARDSVLGGHLRSSMEDAFDVASGALEELQKPQRSPEVNRLLELLFSPEGTAGDQYDVDHLVSTFLGIRAMSQEVEGPDKYENKDDFVSINFSTAKQQRGFFAYGVRRSCSATEIAFAKPVRAGKIRTLNTFCRMTHAPKPVRPTLRWQRLTRWMTPTDSHWLVSQAISCKSALGFSNGTKQKRTRCAPPKETIGRRLKINIVIDLERHLEPQSQDCEMGGIGAQRI
jgi:hypothetical protein